ncbi:MAG: rhomboid family intramembrane serine protease [Leptospiraceae bacterium]|nr:rhomboid family intramembrane serine protease [Leptospiraceae bacterium]
MLLIISYFLIGILSRGTQYKYFYNHPLMINPINWVLATFNHGSFSHLIGNLLFLIFLGMVVEAKVGQGRWLLYYFIAALVSGFADAFFRGIFQAKIPSLGASGAISGLAGAAALLSPYTFPLGKYKFPFPVFLVAWLMVYSDFSYIGSSDSISHVAHLGGFGSLFVTYFFLNSKEQEELKIGFILNFTFFVLSIILLWLLKNR